MCFTAWLILSASNLKANDIDADAIGWNGDFEDFGTMDFTTAVGSSAVSTSVFAGLGVANGSLYAGQYGSVYGNVGQLYQINTSPGVSSPGRTLIRSILPLAQPPLLGPLAVPCKWNR